MCFRLHTGGLRWHHLPPIDFNSDDRSRRLEQLLREAIGSRQQ